LVHGRTELNRAVVGRELARGTLRYTSQQKAFLTWPSLGASRWALVDVFERDGRRYVVAVEDKREPALSRRERDVLRLAQLGRSNKEIAYELGLAYSTITTLLARVAKKLGTRSRAELLVAAASQSEDRKPVNSR
jgi:DNA-binding CsgD family transcriptional regulator